MIQNILVGFFSSENLFFSFFLYIFAYICKHTIHLGCKLFVWYAL